MKRYFILILFAYLFTGLTSCDEIFSVEIVGDGNLKTQKRNIGTFSNVFLDADMEVIIRNGSTRELMVEADSNLFEYISTEINSGILEISEKPEFTVVPRHPVRVYLRVPSGLSDIEVVNGGVVRVDSLMSDNLDIRVFGVSSFFVDTIDCTDFSLLAEGSTSIDILGRFGSIKIHQNGSGNLLLSGSTGSADMVLEGSGKIDAVDLAVENGGVRLYGSGLIFCRVSGVLQTLVDGSGRIYYYGMPEVLTKDISGGGMVLPGED